MGHFINGLANRITKAVSEHGSEIFMIFGITGFCAAIGMSIKATPEAMRALDKQEMRKGEPLTTAETVKTAGKYYILTAATAGASAYCIMHSNRLATKRIAGLTAACQLTEEAFLNYRKATKEAVGEEKEKEICTAARTTGFHNVVSVEQIDMLQCRPGEYPFYDPQRGEVFACNRERIDSAIKIIRLQLESGELDWVSLNDFWAELGLKPTELGKYFGWGNDDPYGGERPSEMFYTTDQCGDSSVACTVLCYDAYLNPEIRGRSKLVGGYSVLQ